MRPPRPLLSLDHREDLTNTLLDTPLTRHAGVEVPLICGAMYPCSNPELVAAASDAGALGILQPVSLTFVHGHDFREGIRFVRRLTPKPIGMNALIEQSSRIYHERMVRWVEIALEEGVRFFVTSLGNPRWVADRVHAVGGVVYHDVTERKWALKGRDSGVDGLIAVNNRAGGHAGPHSVERLLEEVGDLGLPVVCAGGVGDEQEFVHALRIGYAGVQLGTRFIATTECRASAAYKEAILRATENDIVLTERITGVPVSVIRTPYIERMGLRAGPFARWMLRGHRRKHWMRSIYAIRSGLQLKRASLDETGKRDYWQAGKSVRSISSIEPAADIVRRFASAARISGGSAQVPTREPRRAGTTDDANESNRSVQVRAKLSLHVVLEKMIRDRPAHGSHRARSYWIHSRHSAVLAVRGPATCNFEHALPLQP